MENKCTTLQNLSPTVQNWIVKALVAEKTPIRQFSWGKQQKIVLIDNEQHSMQCLIYEQDAAQLDRVLQLYHTYYVGNAKIREIPANVPSLADSKYQITLSRSTFIKPANKDEQLPLEHIYQLTQFAQCPQFADSTDKQINLLCGVIHMFPARFISKVQRNVQDFVIVNEERRPTILTLWEEFLQTEAPFLTENIHNMPVILAMRLTVNTFHGISVGTLPNNTILFDPPIPQAAQLESWLKMNKNYVASVIDQKLYDKANQYKDLPLDSQIRKIKHISGPAEKARSFWIKATLCITNHEQRYYFLACPGCSKPCGAMYKTDFRCLYCNDAFNGPKPILRLEVELFDETGTLNAFVEENEAETIFCMSSEQVIEAESKETQIIPHQVNEKFKDTQWLFHIRAIYYTVKGKKTPRNTIISYLPVPETSSTSDVEMQHHQSTTTMQHLSCPTSTSHPSKPTTKRNLDSAEDSPTKSPKHTKQD